MAKLSWDKLTQEDFKKARGSVERLYKIIQEKNEAIKEDTEENAAEGPEQSSEGQKSAAP
jgi:hypothetical protein